MTFTGKNGTFRATFRKYDGAWVPVVVDTQTKKRFKLVHVNNSAAAAESAMRQAKAMAGEDAVAVL